MPANQSKAKKALKKPKQSKAQQTKAKQSQHFPLVKAIALTHLEQSRFRVENGAVGGENGTSDAWCGSGSHKHIRVDCYELICT